MVTASGGAAASRSGKKTERETQRFVERERFEVIGHPLVDRVYRDLRLQQHYLGQDFLGASSGYRFSGRFSARKPSARDSGPPNRAGELRLGSVPLLVLVSVLCVVCPGAFLCHRPIENGPTRRGYTVPSHSSLRLRLCASGSACPGPRPSLQLHDPRD